MSEYKNTYTPARLKKYRDDYNYPNCNRVCDEVLAIYGMGVLLHTKEEMDDIVNAIRKVYDNRDKLNSL